MKIAFAHRTHDDAPSRCWVVGFWTKRHFWAIHFSVGRPVWWKPSLGRKRYSGITEWRAGWLLAAIQVAIKAKKD